MFKLAGHEDFINCIRLHYGFIRTNGAGPITFLYSLAQMQISCVDDRVCVLGVSDFFCWRVAVHEQESFRCSIPGNTVSNFNNYRGKRLLWAGTVHSLPLELELRGASNRALVYFIIAGILIFFAYMGINAVPSAILGPFGSTERLLVRIGFSIGAILIIGKALLDLFVSSTHFTIDGKTVIIKKRLLTGSSEERVPLADYDEVHWRRQQIRERIGSTARSYRTRLCHIIELVHKDQEKTIPLFIGMSRKPGFGVAREALEKARNINSASAEELKAMEAEVARISTMTEAGDPSEIWEGFAKLLGVPKTKQQN